MPSLNPPTYLRARVLLDIGRSRRREVRKFGHDDISHEGVTSAKRADADGRGGGRTAITRECRKFTTLTLGGARQTDGPGRGRGSV